VRFGNSHYFCTFLHTFWKCDCAIALSKRVTKRVIALLKRATKSAVALSHFWKERKCVSCKCANKPLPNKQGWAIGRFENVRSLFVKSKKVWFRNSYFFCTFLHIHFLKVRLCNCTFEKCDKKCDRIITLLKRATRSVIAQSHFLKEQQKVGLHNPTFEKSKNVRMCKCAISQQAGLSNRTFWKCAINLYKEQKKCDSEIHTFFAHFCTFALFESAIVRSHFWKVRQKNRSHNRT